MPESGNQAGASAGPAVDRTGAPVVDPTKNVTDLVASAIARQDLLAAQYIKRIDDLAAINDKLMEQRDRRQDDLRLASDTHLKAMADLRSAYEEKLRVAESQRIDAIRTVDVGNVTRATEVSTTQAATLANQVSASAEALRNQVALSASAAATSLAQALEPLQKAIDELRRTQYEQQGAKTQSSEGRSSNQWVIGTVIGVVLFVGGIVFALLK